MAPATTVCWSELARRGWRRRGGRGRPRRATPVRRLAWFVAATLGLVAILAPTTHAAEGDWTVDAGAVAYAVATSGDGGMVVVGRRDNTAVAYDRAGRERWRFATEGTVWDVAVSVDGGRVAVASEDRNVYLLDGEGRELWRFQGQQTFRAVSITGDGLRVVAGSEDRQVTVLDESGGQLWQHTAADQVTQVAIYGGAGGFRVVAGTRDSRVAVLGGDGGLLWEATLDYAIRGLSVTRNGSLIAAGDDLGTLSLLDGASGNVLWTTSTGSRLSAVGIAGDGSVVVAGNEGGDLLVLDPEGEEIQRQETTGGVADLALTRDADALAAVVGEEIAFVPRDGGSFALPEPPSRLWQIVRIGGAVLAAVALVAVALGFRRTASGERAWRGTVRRQRRLGREVWRARISYLFLMPSLALLLVFNYYPAFSGIYHAFTVWTPGVETRWAGLDQFRALADNRYFWTGIGNLIILIVTGFLKLLLPLAVAEMIFHLRGGGLRYLMRTAFVLQVIVPGVVGILLWVNIYDPNIGLANQVLRAVGLDSWARFWLGDGDTAIWAIVFIGFPWVSAFALLIFYGGLISIPGDLYDAAALDGASVWRRIVNIDLPLLLGQVRLLMILTFIAMVQEFAAVFLTTGGGPGSATYVPSLELYYQAVRFNNFGGAAAIGAVLFVVILAGTLLNLRFVKSSVEYSA